MKEEKSMGISDYSLFVPRGKQSLMQDYPELKKSAFLNTLRKDKLLFCWYLGCEGSPCYEYYNSDSPKEFEQALKFARKKSGLKITDIEFKDYIENSFLPADLRKGIEIFSNFKLGVRIRLKRMVESMLNNFEKVINVDISSNDFNVIGKDGENTGERDYDKIKKYTDTCINIRNKFSEILEQAEQSFGVSEVEEEERFEVGQSFLDLKHEQNK